MKINVRCKAFLQRTFCIFSWGGFLERKNSILGGAILLTAANFLMRLISIAFNVFLSSRIGASGLGLLQLISTIGVFAFLVGTSGIRVAAMCLSAEEFGHKRLGGVRLAVSCCLRAGLLISCTAGTILFFSAGVIAQTLLHDADATLSLKIMAVFLPFSCISGILSGYFTACAKIRKLVTMQLLQHIFSLLLTAGILLIRSDSSLEHSCAAIIFGSSAGTVFYVLVLYLRYRRDMQRVSRPKQPLHIRKRLVQLCVPIALNDYLRSGLNTAEQLLIPYGLAQYALSGTQAMENYGTIHAMVFPILMFPATILYSVSDLLVPELSRSRVSGKQHRISDLADKCLRMTFLFAAAVAGFFFVSADSLGMMIYNSESAGRFLRVFAPMVLMLYTDAITDGMLKGLAEQVSSVRYNSLTSFLDVAFLYVLLPRWGLSGYVFSFAVTHAINLFLSLRKLLIVSRHAIRERDFLHPLLCASVCVLIALLLPGNPLAKGICYLLMLAGFYLLTNAFSDKDRHWLAGVFRQSIGKDALSD